MTEENTLRGNTAFIDGQNLYVGTKQAGWRVDYKKLRIYLREKYKVTIAYYFLGYQDNNNSTLYISLQKAGYILVFREHSEGILSKKKGNVDSDIIFMILKRLIINPEPEIVHIISGDGDYIKLVQFLIERGLFGKMLFPNKRFTSSLYKRLQTKYFSYLDADNTRVKIEEK